MIEVDTIEIDGTKYDVIGRIDNYVYLSNPDDPKDFMIKKETEKDGEKYLSPIETREEFDKALALFSK